MLVVESCEETAKILRPALVTHQRPKILLDRLVADQFGMLVGGTQRLLRSINAFVSEHCVQCPGKASGGCRLQKGFECFGRPVVVSISVGECQTSHAFRIEGSENLCDAASAVITHEVDTVDLQSVQKFSQHVRVACDRDV